MDTYSKKFAPVICAPWTPTDAAFARYMAREGELARHNLLIAGRHGQTLHSPAVVDRARRSKGHFASDVMDPPCTHTANPGNVPQVIANISVRTKLDGRWIGQA